MYGEAFRKGVKRIISENGYKQKAIADKAGISTDVFSKILTGARRIFVEEAYAISEATGYSLEEILKLGQDDGKESA